MAVLNWGEDWLLGISWQDSDHEQAVAEINAMAEAEPQARLALLDHFIDHCRVHFAHEEEMMRASRFFALVPHKGEHDRVLAELERVRTRLAQGDAQDDFFRSALPRWLRDHRDSMDLVTSQFALSAGATA